ncbi:hypothetical protein [Bradyrhizobium sp. LeoA1S1]
MREQIIIRSNGTNPQHSQPEGKIEMTTKKTTTPKRAWTLARLTKLYKNLVQEFGPRAVWTHQTKPGRGLDAYYAEFCENFGAEIGASKDAVQLQISFTELFASRTWAPRQTHYAVINLAAAWEAGFIKTTDFPAMTVQRSVTNWPEPHSISEPERWAELQAASTARMGEDQ